MIIKLTINSICVVVAAAAVRYDWIRVKRIPCAAVAVDVGQIVRVNTVEVVATRLL